MNKQFGESIMLTGYQRWLDKATLDKDMEYTGDIHKNLQYVSCYKNDQPTCIYITIT